MQAVEKQSSSGAAVLGLSPGKQDRYTCICCRVKFESVQLQRSHFKTEWHLYNLKRRVCLLHPIDIESFNQIQLAAPTDVEDASEFSSSFVLLEQKEDIDASSDTLDDEDWERLDGSHLDEDELLDEDYNEDEIEYLLNNMVPVDTCLFCGKKSTNIRSNIDHMNDLHGFFIPEEKYVVDLDGLMDYLAFKVGAGFTCLWCNKQFSSLHGVRLHMKNKNHSRILYDQQSAVEEFKDYYDYSTQEQIEMKPYNKLALTTTKSRQRRRSETDGPRSPGKQSANQLKQQLVILPRQQAAMVAELNRTKRALKKFNSSKAKNLLQVGLMNNQTMRARLKQQNPI